MTGELTFDVVKSAVAGTAAAFRCVTEYQPMGGPGDKVFPPTYEGGKYAIEERVLPGYDMPVPCVLLNSVQSEANHMELALLEAWDDGHISLPVITVDFAGHELAKDLHITSLEAPHRIADALLRDSQRNGVLFRSTEHGRRLDDVSNKNATPLLELCPTALVFGMWDSAGPRGGLGAKFARALVSEIIGINAKIGVKTGSRIDPAAIVKSAGPVYQAQNGSWTLNESDARREKDKPVQCGKDGKPSEVNHGNVVPSISKEGEGGGITMDKALQTTVLSLPALRRLCFPFGDTRSDVETNRAARTVLAGLGLLAATLMREKGLDLRSRCQLFPQSSFVWELLDDPETAPARFTLNAEQAIAVFNRALDEARERNLPWMEQKLVLSPSPQLVDLVRRSQKQTAIQTGAED